MSLLHLPALLFDHDRDIMAGPWSAAHASAGVSDGAIWHAANPKIATYKCDGKL